MHSLLNRDRPPVFCPGCSHEQVIHALDKAFIRRGLNGNQIVIVSDIGCSGLFDTFFQTHALHGLHGRALTYATGLKLAQPELNVVVTMGDGGQGIGGAHLLAACRRNVDLTLLVLNNFNFGMTGGQFSATTPQTARVASGFLNALEQPMDICRLARTAGAPHVVRCSAYDDALIGFMESALEYKGFSVIDIWGICTGRYGRYNRLTPGQIKSMIENLPDENGIVSENERKEFSEQYRMMASCESSAPQPAKIEWIYRAPEPIRREVIILGDAGQRILTAGEILCLAGMTAGLNVTQKNEYHITVLRGPSISEVILDPEEIGFTGINVPHLILAIGQEGVDRRKSLFDRVDDNCLIIKEKKVTIPANRGCVIQTDFKARHLKPTDWALASLAVIAQKNYVMTTEMLYAALTQRFAGAALESSIDIVKKVRQPK